MSTIHENGDRLTTRVFNTMGTTVSLIVRGWYGEGTGPGTVDGIVNIFDDADQRYSLYRPESELSQIASGSLRLCQASVELRQMYELAISWRNSTHGAFTPHRADGTIDLSGVVKGWAIAQAAAVLAAEGLDNWCINAGGDVLARGTNRTGAWTVGIIDPVDRTALLASVRMPGHLPAIATSGVAERGDHIWTQTTTGSRTFLQVTVLAADIITADALATAIIAGGRGTLDLATTGWPVEVFAVERNGALLATPGFRRILTTAPIL
ncbi:FAD:protein FMN transferase [Arthrobacter sp. A2-55]|uniref:FAD:protein FMN transferase n=1 Tax=Arthrobacter sp. A2-55 TaxID=2897337 RepID=UPI0021CD6337|nr:FAD:protein FMN transferase [Arthrobacter sp. A2-55]MCU6479695.1 FAD:protein FMN transferase [Arthrobacter sp. A2-55]